MSHCTRFKFCYTSEEAIVGAFVKLGMKPTTGVVAEFGSESRKTILGNLGYMGKRQFRAISGQRGRYNMLVCRMEEGVYELLIEQSQPTVDSQKQLAELASEFQRAYVGIAVDQTLRRIDGAGVPSRSKETSTGFLIEFGPSYEFGIQVSFTREMVTEEVFGVQGDLCTKLTEELEAILSGPTAELATEWKAEFTLVHEEQTFQILRAKL